MTAQDLKNAILQLAMQGKLVPQDSGDASAADLVKQIKAEKAQLIKKGKIKKEKALPAISEEDSPFDIPEKWTWIRLGDFCSVYNGDSINATVKQEKYSKPCDGWDFIATKDVGFDHIINYQNGIRIPFQEVYFKVAPAGSILLCMEGGSAGKKIGILDKDVCFGNKLCCFVPIAVFNKYLYYYLQCPQFFSDFMCSMTGLIGGVGAAKLKSIVIPLPPRAEQERIVAKIEELMPLVEEYGKAEERLTTLNADFPDKLRKSILQQAIQGKLTERDPADEPASELLKRISAEKERLIKEGKIKKEKPLPPITEEEIPFEIPNEWTVVRIGDVGVYKKGPFGSSITKNMFVPKGPDSVKVYEQKNAIQKDHTLGEYYIRRSYFNEKMRGFEVFPGDVIVSCAGTIGETYVMPDGIEQGIINQALMRMKIVPSLNLDYFLLYFDYVLKKTAQGSSKGSAIKNIPPFDVFKKMVLPLPPLAEQQRIVDRVNELLAVCDELK
jgi:type I restriction enzyme S subunit